jgi:hypothetical protein
MSNYNTENRKNIVAKSAPFPFNSFLRAAFSVISLSYEGALVSP